MNNSYNKIKERMLQFLEDKKKGDKKLVVKELGMSYEDFKNPLLPYAVIQKIHSKNPELNLHWLITGKGQMIRNIEEQTSCDEIKIIAKERAYIIDLQKDKIEMQNKLIEDLELNLQKWKKI